MVRFPGALESLREVQAWATKAKRQLEKQIGDRLPNFDGVRYGLPGGRNSIAGTKILEWLDEVGIIVEDIPHAL